VEEKFEAGDAFMVKAYKFRRIDADEDTEVFIAGAPVNDEAEEGELE